MTAAVMIIVLGACIGGFFFGMSAQKAKEKKRKAKAMESRIAHL